LALKLKIRVFDYTCCRTIKTCFTWKRNYRNGA
jgi:hypothetical protein